MAFSPVGCYAKQQPHSARQATFLVRLSRLAVDVCNVVSSIVSQPFLVSRSLRFFALRLLSCVPLHRMANQDKISCVHQTNPYY